MYGLRCKCFRYPVSVTGSQHRFSLSSLTDKTRCLDVRFLPVHSPRPMQSVFAGYLPPFIRYLHPMYAGYHFSPLASEVNEKDAESTESANDATVG